MSFNIYSLAKYIPAIKKPTYKPSLKQKLKWTAIILVLYYILSHTRLYGVGDVGQRFRMLEILLGSKFGTLMTLGIGPIVTGSILLQLMVGSKIIEWDISKPEDRKKYDTVNKLLAILFIILEAIAYVLSGAVPPASKDVLTTSLLIVQLSLGGFLVYLMDDLLSKWGIGSGISLFIVAGVVDSIFVRAFTPFTETCVPSEGLATCIPSIDNPPAGIFWRFLFSLITGETGESVIYAIPLIATTLVFLIVIYTQAISIDIPLIFSSVRGFGRRWSLKLFYTSNIPVILTAALLANIQLWGKMGIDPETNCSLLGCFDERGNPVSGILFYLNPPRGVPEVQVMMLCIGGLTALGIIASSLFFKGRTLQVVLVSILLGVGIALFLFKLFPDTFSIERLAANSAPLFTYTIFMIISATLFSVFWVTTAGMDPASIAEQISSMGLRIPGYRSDKAAIKRVLNRYIPALAIIGGISIGLLAAFADFSQALGTGTGILLTVSIIYNFYEQIRAQHPAEAAPLLEKIFGKK
ncbi:MAG TPA: preprotein translocase subunit SecY [Candidatus Aenigmarchaeota archaeon]|nr:preprotein translocase subunit SecY [Candidatus Aenigmarchaeota archaeon]